MCALAVRKTAGIVLHYAAALLLALFCIYVSCRWRKFIKRHGWTLKKTFNLYLLLGLDRSACTLYSANSFLHEAGQ